MIFSFSFFIAILTLPTTSFGNQDDAQIEKRKFNGGIRTPAKALIIQELCDEVSNSGGLVLQGPKFWQALDINNLLIAYLNENPPSSCSLKTLLLIKADQQ